MLTLVEADRLIQPIWDSGFLETDEELKSRMRTFENLIPEDGYQYRNPLRLNQFEIVDDEFELAVRALADRYHELASYMDALKEDIDMRYEN